MKPKAGTPFKRKPVPMVVVDGLGFPFYFDIDKIKETINFQAKANDIFIVSRLFFFLSVSFSCDTSLLFSSSQLQRLVIQTDSV